MKSNKILILLLIAITFLFNTKTSFAALEDDIRYYETQIAEERQKFNEWRNQALQEFQMGIISEEEYNIVVEEFNTQEQLVIEALEEEILLLKESDSITKEDQKPNTIINVAEDGTEIVDYFALTDEEIANLETARKVTVNLSLVEGTSMIDDCYIKVAFFAANIDYAKEIILDASNNYTMTFFVPNDLYYVVYEPSESKNKFYYEDEYLDVNTNPTISINTKGGNSIITEKEEIVKIEGTEYIEPEEKLNIDFAKIITIVLITIAVILGTIFIIKKKREYEI